MAGHGPGVWIPLSWTNKHTFLCAPICAPIPHGECPAHRIITSLCVCAADKNLTHLTPWCWQLGQEPPRHVQRLSSFDLIPVLEPGTLPALASFTSSQCGGPQEQHVFYVCTMTWTPTFLRSFSVCPITCEWIWTIPDPSHGSLAASHLSEGRAWSPPGSSPWLAQDCRHSLEETPLSLVSIDKHNKTMAVTAVLLGLWPGFCLPGR